MNMQPGTPENSIKPNASSLEQLTDLEYENKRYNLQQAFLEANTSWQVLNQESQQLNKEYKELKTEVGTKDHWEVTMINLFERNAIIEKKREIIWAEMQKVWFAANRGDINLDM